MDIVYTPPQTVEAFIQHYLPNQLFYSFIVGPYGPVSGDTEFLTPCGWKQIQQYEPDDLIAQWVPDPAGDPKKGAIEFVKPADYIVSQAETFLHFSNKCSVSMMLSPNHRMPYYDAQGNLKEKMAVEMALQPSKARIPVSFVPSN